MSTTTTSTPCPPDMYPPAKLKQSRSELLLPKQEEANNLTFSKWWKESAWPGMGLFGESYVLFSIGILRPVWSTLYPECFDTMEECSASLLGLLSYGVVLGVISGMLLLGTWANTLGRRRGSILTASLMAFGALGLALVSVFVKTARLLVVCMSALLFVFGVGVGGEYPLSASSASERAMGIMKTKMLLELEREEEQLLRQPVGSLSQSKSSDQPPLQQLEDLVEEYTGKEFGRGKRVLLVFTMQGMGIFCNALVLTLMSWSATLVTQNEDYSEQTLFVIWRISYAIGALILMYVLWSRCFYLEESQVWVDDKARRTKLNRNVIQQTVKQQKSSMDDHSPEELQHDFSNVSSLSGNDQFPSKPWSAASSLKHCPSTTTEEDLKASTSKLLLRNYGWRLFGASMSWLLWDVAFYGNKLFQSTFLLILTGQETTLLELSVVSVLNAFVALVGYFVAAFLVDNPSVGRIRLQQWGLFSVGILFVLCGLLHDSANSIWLLMMYLLSSFLGQVGPNATTFLIPAEIFPTEARTQCHGIAAASGKVGALLAAIVFSNGGTSLFLWSGYASFAASLITIIWLPDTTTLDLYELDRKWRMTLAGKKSDYEGEANNPQYLSWWERRKLKLSY